ncbi:MAG: glycerol-3-phosphate dehydrogenase [bacterium ADurb.Bin478]|nr:MAG: glycerol-3-phosphate dehydrogenase [bacterium ADurb.Bin478]
MEQLADYTQSALRSKPAGLADATIQHLIQTYGTRYARVLKGAPADTWTPLAGSAVIKAEILHGVREEMAQKLSDVVLRRTELGSAGHPGTEALTACAQIMADELGWDAERRQKELAEVEAAYPQ